MPADDDRRKRSRLIIAVYAMQALITTEGLLPDLAAKASVAYADALLIELEATE